MKLAIRGDTNRGRTKNYQLIIQLLPHVIQVID